MNIVRQQHGLLDHSKKAGGERRKSMVMRLIETVATSDGREMKYVLSVFAIAAVMYWAGIGS